MRGLVTLMVLSFSVIHQVANAAAGDFDKKMQWLLESHYQKYKDQEYFSGAALSVYVPKKPIKNYYAGQESHDGHSKNVSESTLFQIGSITKSFTAATILQLEKENKLQLKDQIQQWLPEYSKWSGISIESLLNMSSNLPNYSDAPLWNASEYENPGREWSNQALIHFVYPTGTLNPPLKTGYMYSNTGYILTAMMIEKITKNSFRQELENKTIKLAELHNTYYPVPSMDESIKNRLAHGYNYNQYDNPALVGKDVLNVNLSWAGAAGAIVSNSEDIIKWINALFVENTILDNTQKQKLMSMISTETGKQIAKTSSKDPRGFGLGVIEAYSDDVGRYWFYEGETLGYRALYLYVPCNGIIISSIFNSATNTENDHAGELMKSAYAALLKTFPHSTCKKLSS